MLLIIVQCYFGESFLNSNSWGFMNEITQNKIMPLKDFFVRKNIIFTRIFLIKRSEQVHGLVLLTFEQVFLNFIKNKQWKYLIQNSQWELFCRCQEMKMFIKLKYAAQCSLSIALVKYFNMAILNTTELLQVRIIFSCFMYVCMVDSLINICTWYMITSIVVLC